MQSEMPLSSGKSEGVSVEVNPNIFRQYDVRGIVGRDLMPEGVEILGRGY